MCGPAVDWILALGRSYNSQNLPATEAKAKANIIYISMALDSCSRSKPTMLDRLMISKWTEKNSCNRGRERTPHCHRNF